MFTATVKGFQVFDEVTADIERLVVSALDEAAAVAAAAADADAFLPLELEVFPAEQNVDGFTAGIHSRKTGKRGIRLAPLFDEGTLSLHHGELKRPGRKSWQVKRKGSTYTAHRRQLGPVAGIEAERFFPAARSAGRKALLGRIDRGV